MSATIPGSRAPERSPPVSARRGEYEDFRLLVEGAGGEYRVSVAESPAGETREPVTVRWAAPQGRVSKEGELHRTGGLLFDAFVSGPIRELYRTSIGRTMERRVGLR